MENDDGVGSSIKHLESSHILNFVIGQSLINYPSPGDSSFQISLRSNYIGGEVALFVPWISKTLFLSSIKLSFSKPHTTTLS